MSALQKIDEQTSQRDLRARKILTTARANLAGHVERNERVARALATARANIVRLDPKRLASIRALAPTREQEVAARLRQGHVARTLRNARATCARLADMQAPPHRPARRRVAQGPPQGEATNYYDVQREAIAAFVVEMLDQERDQYQKKLDAIERATDGLHRELDAVRRELDLVHRELAGLRAAPS